jgi:protein-tyrosine phosphatase
LASDTSAPLSIAEMTGLVDLHSHVLPRVDDGARDDDEALRMLRIAEEDGIGTIAATPHAHHFPGSLVPERVERLNQLAADAGLTIKVVPGSEVRLAADLPARHRDVQLLTLNCSRYLLFELYFDGGWPSYLRRVVDELRALGLWPILAHAERYEAVQRDPAPLRDLIAAGVPIQINAASLVGPAERGAQPTAERLIRDRMVHILASDAHNAAWRPPRLRAAAQRVAEIAGADYAAWMLATSAAIVRGEEITLPAPVPVAE